MGNNGQVAIFYISFLYALEFPKFKGGPIKCAGGLAGDLMPLLVLILKREAGKAFMNIDNQ